MTKHGPGISTPGPFMCCSFRKQQRATVTRAIILQETMRRGWREQERNKTIKFQEGADVQIFSTQFPGNGSRSGGIAQAGIAGGGRRGATGRTQWTASAGTVHHGGPYRALADLFHV